MYSLTWHLWIDSTLNEGTGLPEYPSRQSSSHHNWGHEPIFLRNVDCELCPVDGRPQFRTQRECFLWIQTFGQLELLDSTSCLMKGLHPAQRAPLHEGVKGTQGGVVHAQLDVPFSPFTRNEWDKKLAVGRWWSRSHLGLWFSVTFPLHIWVWTWGTIPRGYFERKTHDKSWGFGGSHFQTHQPVSCPDRMDKLQARYLRWECLVNGEIRSKGNPYSIWVCLKIVYP